MYITKLHVDDIRLLFLNAVSTNIHISPPEHLSHIAEPNMCPVAALATLHPFNKHMGSVVLQLFWGHTGTNTARRIIRFYIRIRVCQNHRQGWGLQSEWASCWYLGLFNWCVLVFHNLGMYLWFCYGLSTDSALKQRRFFSDAFWLLAFLQVWLTPSSERIQCW